MRTFRISDLRRGHLRAEFVPKLRVESSHRRDSAGCTIVTIERHSPDRSSTVLYICALLAHAGWPPRESSCCIEPIIVCLLHQEPPRLGSRPRFWRTTQLRYIAFTRVITRARSLLMVLSRDRNPKRKRPGRKW